MEDMIPGVVWPAYVEVRMAERCVCACVCCDMSHCETLIRRQA